MGLIGYVYDSERRARPAVEELVEALRYRDVIMQLVRRDVLTRYKRSVLGVAWTMLNPLGMMLIYTLAFSGIFGATRAFPVYLLSGIIVWSFFYQTTTSAMTQLTWGGALLHKIYLPRTVFAISAVGTGLVNLGLALIPLGIVMLLTGTPAHPAILLLPISVVLLAVFALGVSLLVSSLSVFFPDVAEMYQIVLLGWMFLTPIFYLEDIIPAAYRWWLLMLNPMYHLVKLFRLALYYGSWPSLTRLSLTVGIAIATLAIGWMVFAREADEFAYRI